MVEVIDAGDDNLSRSGDPGGARPAVSRTCSTTGAYDIPWAGEGRQRVVANRAKALEAAGLSE